MKIKKKLAKKISYHWEQKRKRSSVKFIVIHGTGNKGDTAKNNALYFANTNTREAGAHFFVDRKGIIYRSIPMNRTAWAVGGVKYENTEGAQYYKKCTNFNSVSVELCDIVDREPSDEMIKSVKWLVKYIRKYCPNADEIIRHWDVTGKNCPSIMTGKNNKVWKNFKKKIKD